MPESLDMLKTEEGQLNAVFACFGSAAMFAGALGDFLRAYDKVRSKKLPAEELKELTQRIDARTMGQLLRDLRNLVTFSEGDYAKRMKAALIKGAQFIDAPMVSRS